jgi:formylglycine-generating enzyme required for sulfatase activity
MRALPDVAYKTFKLEIRINIEEATMKRSLSILVLILFATILTGCIISYTPKEDLVVLSPGMTKTFSIDVFPTPANFAWYVDDTLMPGATLNTYTFMLDEDLQSEHKIEVRAGSDKHTWNVQYSTDHISVLLSNMVSISGGTFNMGSTEYSNEQPVHAVTLSAFEISAYEVTNAQYSTVMGTYPYPGRENYPAELVDWNQAREFCTRLSALTGRTFTLTSEAQWEYACRAGSTTLYSFGDLDADLGNYAWYGWNSGDQVHQIGFKIPNAWGLYDMHGNVWEWCLDSWHTDYASAPTDGSAWEPETGSYKVLRGGSWFYSPVGCRSAFRYAFPSDIGGGYLGYGIGFRVVALPAGE